MAAVVFLKINGVRLGVDEERYEALIEGIARGRIGKEKLAAFFRKNTG